MALTNFDIAVIIYQYNYVDVCVFCVYVLCVCSVVVAAEKDVDSVVTHPI